MLDSWYDANGKMKPLDGFGWAYMHNAPRSVIVGGGGQVCPSFPALFRFGKGGVKALLEQRSGRTSTAGNVLSGPVEYWEGFRTYAPSIVRGGEPPVPAKGVDLRGNDAEVLLKKFLTNKHPRDDQELRRYTQRLERLLNPKVKGDEKSDWNPLECRDKLGPGEQLPRMNHPPCEEKDAVEVEVDI